MGPWHSILRIQQKFQQSNASRAKGNDTRTSMKRSDLDTIPNKSQFTTRSASNSANHTRAVRMREPQHLAGPVVAVEVADEPLAGLGGGEELLLGDLGVLPVPQRAPLGAALGGAAHLLDPALAERLDVVRIEAVERGDLLIELVLHRLGGRQHLFLQNLQPPKASRAQREQGQRGSSLRRGGRMATWLTTSSIAAAATGRRREGGAPTAG